MNSNIKLRLLSSYLHATIDSGMVGNSEFSKIYQSLITYGFDGEVRYSGETFFYPLRGTVALKDKEIDYMLIKPRISPVNGSVTFKINREEFNFIQSQYEQHKITLR